MKRFSFFIVFLTVSLAVMAQKFVANAPEQVATGDQFRLTYTINTQDVGDFRIGKIPDGLEVLMGPSKSVYSSYNMVNGHTSSSSSITYTFIICATKKGTFNIPAAHITVRGKSIASNTVRINVTGEAAGRGSQGNGGRGGSRQDSDGEELELAGSRISGSNLFIKVTASKKHVHEQEPILLTYKVYTDVALQNLDFKVPDLKGFHTQEIPLPQEKSLKLEYINGRPYKSVVWCQYILYPQRTGKLQIPSITATAYVGQRVRDVDDFEAFFNGGSGYTIVKKQIKAPEVSIQVDQLPEKPANFSGAVGKFSVTAQLNKNDIKSNAPVTVRVIVSGNGNLKLIKQPVVKYPKDFDTYDAKVTDKTKLTANGLEGSMIYDFLAVPRNEGKYEIPPVEFTYYDTQTNSYKTIKSNSLKLNVAKGSDTQSVSDFTGLDSEANKDIKYIKTGDTDIHDLDDFFFGSTKYMISIAILLLIFISLFIIFRQRAINNANISKMRGKKANKVATKRLKTAYRLMSEGKDSLFYDEVLRALWGYVGDKLNIAVEKLSRENICAELSEKNVDNETVDQFICALDECEFERYAPGDTKGNMRKTYETAMTAIMKIEDAMKRQKKKKHTATIILLMILLIPMQAAAITKENADSSYARKQYQQAIEDYEELLERGVSSDIYYNLGNAYYRTNNITKAVLNYERALLLSPGDADIRFNLQMARSKTIDKITPESEMFFVTWYHSIVNITSVDGWARTALISLAMAIILALTYLFANPVWLRKTGFFGGISVIILFIISNIFAANQKHCLNNRNGAIITAPSVSVKSSPSTSGNVLFILHEGTKVEVTDNSMKEWKQIKVADGKDGWIETSKIEII